MTYYIGLDLGQLQDYTARAVLHVADPPPAPEAEPVQRFHPTDGGAPSLRLADGRRATAVLAPPVGEASPLLMRCVGLHRWPLKTKYAAIVADMRAFLGHLPEGEGWELLIDGTGVGVAVLEQFDAAGIKYTAVSIHGGQETTRDGHKWRVPKKALVAALQVAAQNRTLAIDPPGMPLAKELRAEMGNFRHTITAAANDTYAAWREADHDDLVLALAIACWGVTKPVYTFQYW
jgi:hypothetical protein